MVVSTVHSPSNTRSVLLLLDYDAYVSPSYFELVFAPFHPGTTAFADHTGAN